MATPARDVEPPRPSVFLRDYVDVEQPDVLVSQRLSSGQTWLARVASAAGEDTESRLVRLGPALLGELITREVRVRLGEPSSHADGLVVPLRWEDARRPGLFPLLDGNLQVVALGDGGSRIILFACYRPPFDGIGMALDQAIFHRVAESTVRSFLRKVAETLDAWPQDDG